MDIKTDIKIPRHIISRAAIAFIIQVLLYKLPNPAHKRRYTMPIGIFYIAVLAAALFTLASLLGVAPWQALRFIAANFTLGYGSLALVNFLASATAFAIPINAVTLLAGGCLGLPGTILAAALQFVPFAA